VNGETFDTWTNISISAGLDQAAASFDLSVGRLAEGWREKLMPGSIVEISVLETKVLRGVIDSRTVKTSGTDASLDISGRDVMGLLVDCSIEPGLYCIGRTLEQIAGEVIRPFAGEGATTFGPTLRIGSRDAADDDDGPVRKVQKRLVEIKADYYTYAIDGIFGWRTRNGVMAFQKDSKIQVDGIVGPQTWRALGIEAEGANAIAAFGPEVQVRCFEGEFEKKTEKGKTKYRRTDDKASVYIATVQQIADEKIGPYEKKPKSPEPGETCEGFLRKLAEEKGASIWADADGNLVIGDRKWERDQDTVDLSFYVFDDANIETGNPAFNNLKDVQITHTITGRFSKYQFYGKVPTSKGKQSVSRVAHDPTVRIYKPRFDKVDTADTREAFDNMVASERDAGLAARFQVSGTAVGFGQVVDGKPFLFSLNKPVRLVHDPAGIDDEFYISQLTYSLDASGGPQTSLTLTPCRPAEGDLDVHDGY